MKDIVLLLVGAAFGAVVTWWFSVRASRVARVLARGLEKLSQGAPVQFNKHGPLATRETRTATVDALVADAPKSNESSS